MSAGSFIYFVFMHLNIVLLFNAYCIRHTEHSKKWKTLYFLLLLPVRLFLCKYPLLLNYKSMCPVSNRVVI